MRHVNGVYTQRFNRLNNQEGQLFRGRYKAVVVDEDSYLLEVLRYIHRNPLKAGIVKKLDDYPWSSHKVYLSGSKKRSWLQKDVILSQFTEKKARQKKVYLDFVSEGEPEEIEKFYSLKNLPLILGNSSFKDNIREKFSDLANRQEVPESKVLALDAQRVISIVCEHFSVSQRELLVSKRGTENLPRDIAVYLVRQFCAKTLLKVGEEFGISNYSTVSSVIQRVKVRCARDRYLQKEIGILWRKIKKVKRVPSLF